MNQETKKKLHEAVLAHKDELVQLVSQLIQINSENPCGTQDEVIAFVRQYLGKCGIETQQIPLKDIPSSQLKWGTAVGTT